MAAAVPGFYAGWGRRFAAWAIDAILISLLTTVPSIVLFVAGPNRVTAIVGLALDGLMPVVYYVGFTGSSRGQTPGKMALGIAVRHRASLGRLGYGRAFGRWLATAIFWVLLAVPALLDALWPLVDSENRAWHDLVSGSVVIRL